MSAASLPGEGSITDVTGSYRSAARGTLPHVLGPCRLLDGPFRCQLEEEAGFSEDDPPARTLEQGNTEFHFERANLHAQRKLNDVRPRQRKMRMVEKDRSDATRSRFSVATGGSRLDNGIFNGPHDEGRLRQMRWANRVPVKDPRQDRLKLAMRENRKPEGAAIRRSHLPKTRTPH